MDDGMVSPQAKNLEFLGSSWIQARELEKAVRPLEKAARMSNDGEDFYRLAHLHFEREKWKEAANALDAALKRGQLKNPGQAYLLKGIAYFSMKRLESARAAFSQAHKYEKTRVSSVQWLKHLDENSN